MSVNFMFTKRYLNVSELSIIIAVLFEFFCLTSELVWYFLENVSYKYQKISIAIYDQVDIVYCQGVRMVVEISGGKWKYVVSYYV